MASIVSQSIKNLKGGISQQPHMLRYPEQGTAQINGWSSETEGLQKRPPLKFLTRLDDAGAVGANPFTHLINRDQKERYYAHFTGTGVKVYDLDGVEKTVVMADAAAQAYVTVANPRDSLRCITVADYTFVVNKNVIVKEGTTMTDGGTFTGDDVYHDCLIAVKGGQYGRHIKITINGQTADYLNPPGIVPATYGQEVTGKVYDKDGNPTGDITNTVVKNDGSTLAAQMPQWTDAQFIIDNPTVGTNSIPGQPRPFPDQGLAPQLRTKLGAGWTVETGPGWIHVTSPAGTPITEIRVDDGYANQLANAIVHQVTAVAKLPVEAPNNYKVEITGDTTKSGDRYFVQYNSLDKVWKEAVGWNIIKGLDATTMPHALVRKSDGTFILTALNGTTPISATGKVQTWSERMAGDDDTNPQPSFVGTNFNDVFMFRNRLGLLAGENIILSRTSHYFNFYPVSVANESDDDPIDVAISHNRVSILKYAVPFAEELLLWSDQAQFVLTANGILSAKTIELNLTTQFDVSDYARPFGLGRNVYFAAPRSTFTSMMRYYSVADVSAVKNAEDTSAHVPAYIPNGVYSIFGTSTENFMTVLSANAPSKIFIYKYLYQNEELAQQSWSHWDFGPDIKIIASSSIGSTIFVMYENDNDLMFGTMDFTKNTKDFPEEPYRTFIDFKKIYEIPTGTYDINTNQTVIYPYGIYNCKFRNEHEFVVILKDGFVQRNKTATPYWFDDTAVRLTGNLEGEKITCGFTYEFQYTFSQFLIKKQADDGTMTSEDVGRLQLRRAWINYQDSGAFDLYTITGNRAANKYTFGGTIVNSTNAIIGQLNFPTGQFRFPCQGAAPQVEVTLLSSHTTPVSIIGCGWEGVHCKRSTGI